MVNPALRNYRIPAFADVPRSEVFFADTYDTIGPLGAKSQGECAINPVAPAIAQRARERDRRALRAPAVHAGPHLRRARSREGTAILKAERGGALRPRGSMAGSLRIRAAAH